MADLMRHTAVWEGTPGLPGYTQFYHAVTDGISTSAQEGSDAVRSFFGYVVSLIPDGITVTVDPVAQIINEVTGQITGEVTTGTPAQPVNGVYAGGWSRQIGALIEWTTNAFVGGRRLRGRTYLVPLGGIGDQDGTLSTSTLAVLDAALPWIVGGNQDFRVWHRPVNGAGGSSSSILSGVIRDKAALLNSRMN